jgi:hypothetical protein
MTPPKVQLCMGLSKVRVELNAGCDLSAIRQRSKEYRERYDQEVDLGSMKGGKVIDRSLCNSAGQ